MMRDRQGMKFYYSGICTTMPHLKNIYNLQNVENYFKKSSLSLDILAKHSLREKCVCVLVCIMSAQCFVFVQKRHKTALETSL